ncbi:MAG: hypothetical protein WAV50_00790 [Minisyncoccia bacterium]
MFRKILVVTALLAIASLATAADFSCSLWTQVASRALFNNTGTFGTDGAVLNVVPECTDTKTGFYGNLFLAAPMKNFANGKEIDVRLGKRFQLKQVKVDASAAYYYFGVAGDMYRTGNGRVRVSRMFDVGHGITVQPYGTADYQRSFSFGTNSLGLAAGAVVESKLASLPGRPTLTADVSYWRYATTTATNKGPIVPLDIVLNFPVTDKVTVGLHAMQVWGNVADHSHKPKHMFGLTMFTMF